jgi:(p)ppGpp synthase/HD superfamily hydrolase
MAEPTVQLTDRYAEAVAYASALHAQQVRKKTSIPYISHLLAVSALVLEAGGDEEMAIAALLHDGPEDQGGQRILDDILERFGPRVAEIVRGCTDSLAEDPEDKDDWETRKKDYLEHLEQTSADGLAVSLADKLHNARSIVTDLLIGGASVWGRFTASPDRILWYYQSILDVAERRCDRLFLVVNLREAIGEMTRLQEQR